MITYFFFNDTATTEIYTLSLHDALPIFAGPAPRGEEEVDALLERVGDPRQRAVHRAEWSDVRSGDEDAERSEEHTSELQSRQYLVCRLLLEKKNIHLIPCTL